MIKTEAFENSTLFMGLTTKNGYKASKLFSQKASNGNGDFVWNRASTAYRLNQEGILEEMGNNVPRVDYTNTCPEILIEKQSTNIIRYSESTISWNNTLATNSGNILNINAINFISNVILYGFYPNKTLLSNITNGNSYTLSCYVDFSSIDNTSTKISFGFYYTSPSYNEAFIEINKNTKIPSIETQSGLTITSYECKQIYGNIYKISLSVLCNTTSTALPITIIRTDYVTGGTFRATAFQFETSSYSTSYIPTTSASVTRVKDIAYNIAMDFSSGFTSTVGTLFVRCRVQNSVSAKTDVIISMNGGDDENYITAYTDKDNNLTISTYTNPDQNDYTYALGANGIYNIAIGYDLGAGQSISIAVNGVLKRASSSVLSVLPPYLSRMDLGAIYNGLSTQIDNRIIGVMWFDSQLSDTDIVNITA